MRAVGSGVRLGLSLSLLGALCACSPPAAPPLEPKPAGPAAPAAAEAFAIGVVAVVAPKALTLDGDLSEWGALPPPRDPAPIGPADRHEAEQSAKSGSKPQGPPKDDGAASRLAVAFSKDAFLMAADLGPAASSGFSIAVGGWEPDVPLLGQSAGRAGFLELQCEFQVECWEAGESGEGTACGVGEKPNPPEVVASCNKLVAHHAALVAEHRARFTIVLRVEPSGVVTVLRDGASKPVAGAKVAFKTSAKGATAEVSIPLFAMPRFGEAPLPALRLYASAQASDIGPEVWEPGWAAWTGVGLPQPLALEPWAGLRAKAFEAQMTFDPDRATTGTTLFTQPKSMSYHPSDPGHFECMEGTGEGGDFSSSFHSLYEKKASLGDVEVGLVDYCDRGKHVAVLKAGNLLEVTDISGDLEGIFTKGSEIHVLSSRPYGWDPGWQGYAVGESGKRRAVVEKLELAADRPDPKEKTTSSWEAVKTFHSKGLDSFGWTGEKKRTGVEVTFTWDEGKKMYVGKERKVPVKPKPKKRAGKT